jgi:flagellar hook assembly protein FlgD
MAASTFRNGSSWKPQFDLTKAVQAGSLEIRNDAGTLVRSIPTKASPTGSIRDVAWDGRDAAGSLVTPGTYTWNLAVSATDTSGGAVSIDGQHSPTGQVQVHR